MVLRVIAAFARVPDWRDQPACFGGSQAAEVIIPTLVYRLRRSRKVCRLALNAHQLRPC